MNRTHAAARSHASRYTALCACVLFLAACGDSARPSGPSPTPDPSVARLAVTIDSLGSSAAITSLSQVEFDARGSTGPGPLQYAIDFGDQTSATAAQVRHVYQAPGIYQASVTVTDAAGRRSSATQTVTVRSLIGSWYAAGLNRARGRAEVRRLTLASQDGATVSGEFQVFGGAVTRVTGRLENERTLKVDVPGLAEVSGRIPSQVTGEGAVMPLAGLGAADEPSIRATVKLKPAEAGRMH